MYAEFLPLGKINTLLRLILYRADIARICPTSVIRVTETTSESLLSVELYLEIMQSLIDMSLPTYWFWVWGGRFSDLTGCVALSNYISKLFVANKYVLAWRVFVTARRHARRMHAYKVMMRYNPRHISWLLYNLHIGGYLPDQVPDQVSYGEILSNPTGNRAV